MGGFNSHDLSPGAIEKFCSAFESGSSSKAILAEIIVKMVVKGREVVFLSIFSSQGIQMKDCPSKICPEQ